LRCFLTQVNFKQQFLRQSQNLSLKLIPSKKTLILEGPLGAFSYLVNAKLNYSGKEKKFWLSPKSRMKKSSFVLGQVLLTQSCLGVVLGYRCQLNLVGIGYTASIEKKDGSDFLVLKLGFSHPVKILLPNYLQVSCPKPRIILIKGINLQKVNNFAALIKDLKLPNPYKEKGLYYKGEVFKLKQGKKT
jgi:large subunit ribosomal protein L6